MIRIFFNKGIRYTSINPPCPSFAAGFESRIIGLSSWSVCFTGECGVGILSALSWLMVKVSWRFLEGIWFHAVGYLSVSNWSTDRRKLTPTVIESDKSQERTNLEIPLCQGRFEILFEVLLSSVSLLCALPGVCDQTNHYISAVSVFKTLCFMHNKTQDVCIFVAHEPCLWKQQTFRNILCKAAWHVG